jgi:hypothetical protein
MGIFGPFCFKTKDKRKWYIHKYEGKGRRQIYFLDRDEREAIDLPDGFEVIESPKSGIPMLRKLSSKKKVEE